MDTVRQFEAMIPTMSQSTARKVLQAANVMLKTTKYRNDAERELAAAVIAKLAAKAA